MPPLSVVFRCWRAQARRARSARATSSPCRTRRAQLVALRGDCFARRALLFLSNGAFDAWAVWSLVRQAERLVMARRFVLLCCFRLWAWACASPR